MQLKKREKNHKLWLTVRCWASFQELSYQPDLDESLLSRIANGYRQPSEEAKRKICAALGKSASELGF